MFILADYQALYRYIHFGPSRFCLHFRIVYRLSLCYGSYVEIQIPSSVVSEVELVIENGQSFSGASYPTFPTSLSLVVAPADAYRADPRAAHRPPIIADFSLKTLCFSLLQTICLPPKRTCTSPTPNPQTLPCKTQSGLGTAHANGLNLFIYLQVAKKEDVDINILTCWPWSC